MFDEVNVYEYPALADLGARYLAGASLLLQCHGMNVQERGGGLEIERVHARTLLACVCDETLSTQIDGRYLLAAVTHLAADDLPCLAIDFLLLRCELL